MLDPQIRYLNHGTVGATPRRVLERQQTLRDRMESNPAAFLFREVTHMVGVALPGPGALREAATTIANFVGSPPDDLGFVTNVTAGINAVLRSIPFAEGDEILLLNHAYGAVAIGAQEIGRPYRATICRANLQLPLHGEEQVLQAVENALTPRTRLAILDHVTSSSALLLPIKELVKSIHARGIPVLVDGAHAPGAVPVNVTEIGADWYAANLHKWAWSPRSCGFLYAQKDRQQGLHAPILSWGVDHGIASEFDWQGTSDPTPMLSAPEGIAMLQDLGLSEVQLYNHAFAWRAALALRDELGASLLAPESMVGTMATVILPREFGESALDASRLRNHLWFKDRIEVQIQELGGRVVLRISGQIYNDDEDIEALVRALAAAHT